MKILILGAGQVGSTLAMHLVTENHDITIVDNNPEKLFDLQSKIDVRTVLGAASYPNILKQAGADDADILIAVTSSDETNMIACQVAYSLFKIPKKLARIRSTHYLIEPELFKKSDMPVDVIISPEQINSDEITRRIVYPNTHLLLYGYDKRVVGTIIYTTENSYMAGKTIDSAHTKLPNLSFKVAAKLKGNTWHQCNDRTIASPEEAFFIFCFQEDSEKIFSLFHPKKNNNKSIIVGGGGHIGSKLCLSLEENYSVKVIDNNKKALSGLSMLLRHALVLKGNICDESLLISESIEHTDVFCALTQYDETNIMASLLAKKNGAKQVITLVNQDAYEDLNLFCNHDHLIFPHQATLSVLLSHIRRGDIISAQQIFEGHSELLELVVHGENNNSLVVGKLISKITLPKGVIIVAIKRKDDIWFDLDKTVIHANDHVILMITDLSQMNSVEQLFQVAFNYSQT